MRDILTQLSPKFAGRIGFASFDTDPPEHHAIVRELCVMNLPFLALYRKGAVVKTFTGMRPLREIEAALQWLESSCED
jgi:thioredoxin-like negative regulator of GroEL